MSGSTRQGGWPHVLDPLLWAWSSHRRVPYRWSEMWTKEGRRAHYRRWVDALAEEVRVALKQRSLAYPSGWTAEDLNHLHEVFVEGCYNVDGFLPSAGEVVIDAGCEWGDFTCLAVRSGSHVIAFDPSTDNVRRTEELLTANGFRAEVHAAALGRRSGSIHLSRAGDRTLSIRGSGETQEVPVRSLDELALPSVRLLKVDVEGMELDVLRGGETMLGRDRPKIIVEVHGKSMAEEVGQFLGAAGYSLVRLGPRKRVRNFGFVRDTFWSPRETPPLTPPT